MNTIWASNIHSRQKSRGRYLITALKLLVYFIMISLQELKGLSVSVDHVAYQAGIYTNPEKPHCFAYYITIINRSNIAVTIRGRKWVLRNGRGEINAVEGEGIVGKCPKLNPGDLFNYNSFRLLETEAGVAEGAYLAVDSDGNPSIVRIPKFELSIPM